MLYTNIIHRVDVSADSRAAMAFQWSEARRLGVATTALITYPALFMDDAIEAVEALRGPGDELGLHFHNLTSPRFKEVYQTREPAFWLLPRDKRVRLIDEMVDAFARRFGAPPRSVGGYIIDAWTLDYMKRTHPSIEIAITSCFEEGVKMFYGNNRNWLLFSDGGPWNPYFPHRNNALIPAPSVDEAVDIVAVPHLNRDMIMALSSRDDWFASHPGNIHRARIQEGADSPYFFRFLKEWEKQAALNGWSYLNIFVSSPWMSAKHWAIDRIEDARALYTKMLEHLCSGDAHGTHRNLTMGEFSEAFRAKVRPGDATLCHWNDVLRQSKRSVVWSVNSHHRCAFDMARGGALVDFRPYAGRLSGDLGPETELLHNGNHPFLVSTEHCGGHWNTSHHATISDGKNQISLTDRRLRSRSERIGENRWIIHAEPVTVELGGETLVYSTRWEVGAGPDVRIIRTILSWTGTPGILTLTEIFLGRPGSNEYPQDMRGIRLALSGEADSPEDVATLDFAYGSEERSLEGAVLASAEVPELKVAVALRAETPALLGWVRDSTLFSPKFALELTHAITPGKEIITCLTTRPLQNP